MTIHPTLQAISQTMKTAEPVFIIGTKRSGTSLLYRTLQKHPDFEPNQIDLTETALFRNADKSYRFNRQRPWQLINFMLKDQERYGRFLETIRPIQKRQRRLDVARLPTRLFRRHPRTRRWWWQVLHSHLVARCYLYYAREARGCRRLVEKTPHNVLLTAYIQRAFPRARLLCLLRHPIDVFSSRRRRGQMNHPDHGDLLLSPEKFCQIYRRDMTAVLTKKDNPAYALLLVKYETFTQEPESEFARICAFLGVPFTQTAVIEENPDPKRWQPDPHLFGAIVAKTKSWQDYMDRGEARFIERSLAPLMAALNYKPYVHTTVS